MWMLRSFRRDAMSLVALGDIVLMSMTVVPAAAPSMTPSAPKITCSTSGVSVTIVMTTSLPAAASLGLPTRSAPASMTSWTRGRSVRL